MYALTPKETPQKLTIDRDIRAIKRAIVRHGGAPVGEVESVKLEGKFDDDSPANLDLLEFRMWSVMDIKPDPKTRRLMYADRISAIRKSFAQHQADLVAMFTPPKKGN